jgi:small subunit ribosomal protein S16
LCGFNACVRGKKQVESRFYFYDENSMVVIRLSRGGAKKRPFYRMVATDKRNRRDGRFIERLGYFNPSPSGQEKRFEIDLERVDYWVGTGAQLSDRAASVVKEARKSVASA